MLIINYVHKLQGLDKSLPVCMELRAAMNARVITVIDREPGCLQSDIAAFEPLLEQCCDKWLIHQDPERSENQRFESRLIRRWLQRQLPGTRLLDAIWISRRAPELQKVLASLHGEGEKLLLLTIYNGVNTLLGGWLSRFTVRRQGQRVGYLKSLHDQGLGLSDLGERSSNLTHRLIIRPGLDALLTPRLPVFRSMLERKGVEKHQMIQAGYPPAYPRWQELMRRIAKRQMHPERMSVILFSRGEVAHKPRSEQIIDDHWLYEAIETLEQELTRLWPDHELLIKPHPYQKREQLVKICKKHSSMRLVSGPPCLLVAGVNLAVATYSSAILDAVSANIPAIEWFEENQAFRRLHPDGSPFPNFGVRQASRREQLRELLETLASGEWPRCDKMEALGRELDLKAFSGSRPPRKCLSIA